jgi:hypothetical protein
MKVSSRAIAPPLLFLLAAACSTHQPARPLATPSASASATTTAVTPKRVEATPEPAIAPVQSGVPAVGAAGKLASAEPGKARGTSFQLWFAGVPLGQDGGHLVIVYPAMSASSDGKQTVAHAKVAVFRCASQAADGTSNYTDCKRRAVEYGELSGSAARIVRAADGRLSLVGRFRTYTYGASVDRDPKVKPRWTGRSYLIRVDLTPIGDSGDVDATVTLGGGSAAVSATLDTGYANKVHVPAAAPHQLRRPAHHATRHQSRRHQSRRHQTRGARGERRGSTAVRP